MAVAMVVNGRLLKVAAAICGLLLTVYALYVYREVTSELQQCGKDMSAAQQQYKTAQGVISDLENDSKQARSVSSACQSSYAKLLEESGKKKSEADQSIKKLTAALDIERKAKEGLITEQDLRSSKCTSDTQSLRLQLDTSQKKCSEDKNQLQNKLDEVISHNEIVEKQQQVCSDETNKLTNEKAELKSQNDELMSRLKSLQQQVKTLLEKKGGSALNKLQPQLPDKERRLPNIVPPQLPDKERRLPNIVSSQLPDKEKKLPNPVPLPNAETYNVRKVSDPVRYDEKFKPLGIQVTAKPEGNPKLTPATLPPTQVDDDEDAVSDKEGDKTLTLVAPDKEKESQPSKREDQPDLEEKQDLGGAVVEQAGKDAANKIKWAPVGNDEEAEDPDRPNQYSKEDLDDGLAQLQQDLKGGALEAKGGALEAKAKAAIDDRNDQS